MSFLRVFVLDAADFRLHKSPDTEACTVKPNDFRFRLQGFGSWASFAIVRSLCSETHSGVEK